MTDTPNLALPQIAAAQAQKHVTHNEALALLDALVQMSVVSRAVLSPPAIGVNGARYIIPASATGVFAGRTGQIALFDAGIWRYLMPKTGWQAYVQSEAAAFIFNGAAWVSLGQAIGTIDQVASLGIGTSSDVVNKLSVRSSGALVTAPRVAAGGTGDARLTLEKEIAARTASLVLQNNYSGRAEFGLMGDDDVRLKVSADGSLWRDALAVDRNTGQVSFPNGASGIGGNGGIFGQCRLIKSGANLVLTRFNGNLITVAGVARNIPSAGVSLSATGLAPATTYFIYAFMLAGALTLEASTTAHLMDDITALEIKTGDSSRTFVGMARTIAGPAWQDAPTQRFTLSWFNRRPRHMTKDVTAIYSTTSTTYSEFGAGAQRLEYLTWADNVVDMRAMITVDAPDNGSTSTLGYLRMMFDGAAIGGSENVVYVNSLGNCLLPISVSSLSELAEGYRFSNITWRVLTSGHTLTNYSVGTLSGVVWG